MRIAITGSTGLIGSTLVSFFQKAGHQVSQISLRTAFNVSSLEGMDVIIHLAGANIGARWDGSYKQEILSSRVNTTALIAKSILQLKQKPRLLISASAVGYYGNHAPDVVLDEKSPLGQGYLPDVCSQWEAQTKPVSDAGIRVVHTRFGVVLSKKGGALAKMWLPFQLGLGGVLGNGQQIMSYISLSEIPFIVEHLIQHEDIQGAVNVVVPRPVTNKEFTKTLGEVIKRPTILPVPAFGVKLLFGEMGERLLLEGAYVLPRRLQETRYQFRYPDLKSALEEAVK